MVGRGTSSKSAFASIWLAVALAIGIAGAAHAAEIEEILVTARAVDESVRDVPVAISAFNEEQLQRFAIRDLEDLAASSASLEIGRIASGNGAQIAIRGISSSPGSLGIEQSVALILDGVYFPQGRTINEGLFDARQVAILKGPQALYFGKNASAGAVVVTTNDPGPEREAFGRLGYEIETKTINAEAVLSVPLSDRWGVRAAVQGTWMSDGYLKNVAGPTTYTTFDAASGFAPTVHENGPAADSWIPGEESISGRLTLKGEINDSTTLKVKATYTDFEYNSVNLSELYDCPTLGGKPHSNTADPDNPGFQKAIANPFGGECMPDRSRGLNPIPPTVAATTKDLNQFGGDPGEAYESFIFTADLETRLDNFLIRNILNYHSQDVGWVIDADGGASTSIFASEFNQFENFSFESRTATTFAGALNGVLGFYYQTTDRKFRQEVIFAGAEYSAADPTNRFIAYDKVSFTDGETVSGYGELIWDIGDNLQLTGGARYIWENKDSEFTQPYVNPAFSALFIQDRVLASDKSYDDVVAELTMRYQPTDNLTYYVAYKQGWKSGGFDNGSIDSTLNSDPIGDITYEPEEVDGVEGGVKGVFLDGALSLDFDIYHYQFKNLQLNFFNATTFAYRTLNAGVAETTGGELQVNWATQVEGLTLSAAIAYNDASYKEFLAPCYGGQSFAEGCNIGTGALKDQDLSGEPRGLAPKWRGNLGFNYRRPVGAGLEMSFAGNLKFSDNYTLSEYITNAVQDSYVLLDASVRLGSDDGRWTVAVIGRNLTDKYIRTSAADAPSTGGNTGTDRAFQSDRYAFFKLPRTIAFEVSMRL